MHVWAKEKSSVTTHQALVHDIGGRWYPCIAPGCEYQSKQKSNVTKHIATMHGIGTRWFACPEQGCVYKAKQKSNMKKHVNRMHPNSSAQEMPIEEVLPDEP